MSSAELSSEEAVIKTYFSGKTGVPNDATETAREAAEDVPAAAATSAGQRGLEV